MLRVLNIRCYLELKKTLAKYNPVIIIESFANKFEQVNSLLNSYGYKMIKDLGGSKYVYIKE